MPPWPLAADPRIHAPPGGTLWLQSPETLIIIIQLLSSSYLLQTELHSAHLQFPLSLFQFGNTCPKIPTATQEENIPSEFCRNCKHGYTVSEPLVTQHAMLSAVTPRQLSHETSIGLRSFDFDFERTLREYTTVKKAPRLACMLFARSVLDFTGV